MPRLGHTKTKTGCQSCKARKVKCDEIKPKCTSCLRHNVTCDYTIRRGAKQQALPSLQTDVSYNAPPSGPNDVSASLDHVNIENDPKLEVRLMHHWTAYTCETFSPAVGYWRSQAPLVALDFRYVFDALLSLAALHASRQPPAQWISVEGIMIPIRNPIYNASHPESDLTGAWKNIPHVWKTVETDQILATSAIDDGNMYLQYQHLGVPLNRISRIYLGRAIEGHREALTSLTVENIEAVFMTSVLLSFCALFSLSENEDDLTNTALTLDPVLWLNLARGIQFITKTWREMIGKAWMIYSGIFYGLPDLTNNDELFDPENRVSFERLLTWAEEFEVQTTEDKNAYQDTLSYIGLIYKGIMEDTEDPLVSCRRFIAMPPRCPTRFVDLVAARQPRAITILAHFFAMMKLIDDKVPWYVNCSALLKGIAERQVPKMYEQLPVGWYEMMAWPMAVIHGEVERPSKSPQAETGAATV